MSEFLDTYLRGNWTSLVDIALVAVVIYWIFILIRGTRAVRIVIGLSILYAVFLVLASKGYLDWRRSWERDRVVA